MEGFPAHLEAQLITARCDLVVNRQCFPHFEDLGELELVAFE
jgi:hypothetical protein